MSNVDRHVGVDLQQLAARARLGGVRQQRLAILFLRHLRGPLEQRVERAVGRDQLARALFADPGTPLTLSMVSPISASTSTT